MSIYPLFYINIPIVPFGKTVQEIMDNMTVMDDTFFHKLVEDKGFYEEQLQVVLANPNFRLVVL